MKQKLMWMMGGFALMLALLFPVNTDKVQAEEAASVSGGNAVIENLAWGDNFEIKYDVKSTEGQSYDCTTHVYQDEEEMYTEYSIITGDTSVSFPFANHLGYYGYDGNYTFRITLDLRGNNGETLKEITSDESLVKYYTYPGVSMEQTGITWDLDHPGTIKFASLEGALYYDVNIIDAEGKNYLCGNIINVESGKDSAGHEYTVDFSASINNSGKYYARIFACSGDVLSYGHSTTVSEVYNASTNTMETVAPTNLKWNNYTVSWDPLEGVQHYDVVVYDSNGNQIGTVGLPAETTSYNLTWQMDFTSDTTYYFTVQAEFENGAKSSVAKSPEFYHKGIAAPTNVTLTDNYTLQFDGNEKYRYDIRMYKDGKQIQGFGFRRNSSGTISNWMGDEIEESGSYVIKVRYSDWGDIEDWNDDGTVVFGDWAVLPAFNYVRPDVQMPSFVPTWSASKAATVVIPIVENFGGYELEVEKYDEAIGEYVGVSTWSTNYHNFGVGTNYMLDISSSIKEAGKYRVHARYFSKDIDTVANGSFGGYSLVYNTAETVGKVTDVLNNVVEQSKTDAAAALETLLDDTSKSDLRVAMQTDSSVLENMASLEKNYAEQQRITVNKAVSEEAKAVGVDSGKISVIGAALNANNANTNVTLDVAVPEKKINIEPNRYTDSVQLDIKLVSEGQEMHGLLKVPVTITMPVPAGVDLSHLALLHYYADGSGYEVVKFKTENGMITFTVDRFSTFVFAKEVAESESDDNEDDDDNSVDEVAVTNSNVKDNVPKTGDSLPVAVPMTAAVVLICAAVVLKKKEV